MEIKITQENIKKLIELEELENKFIIDNIQTETDDLRKIRFQVQASIMALLEDKQRINQFIKRYKKVMGEIDRRIVK